jgi:hypothetical protein
MDRPIDGVDGFNGQHNDNIPHSHKKEAGPKDKKSGYESRAGAQNGRSRRTTSRWLMGHYNSRRIPVVPADLGVVLTIY